MFINSVKDYILKNSSKFKTIEIKHYYEFKQSTKLAAISILIDGLSFNVYDYLVEAVAQCIIKESNKANTLYLVTTIASTYEELDDKVTARISFSV